MLSRQSQKPAGLAKGAAKSVKQQLTPPRSPHCRLHLRYGPGLQQLPLGNTRSARPTPRLPAVRPAASSGHQYRTRSKTARERLAAGAAAIPYLRKVIARSRDGRLRLTARVTLDGRFLTTIGRSSDGNTRLVMAFPARPESAASGIRAPSTMAEKKAIRQEAARRRQRSHCPSPGVSKERTQVNHVYNLRSRDEKRGQGNASV